MKKAVIFCIVALMCCACGSTKYVPRETVKTEYREQVAVDSIVRYDSIYVKEKGDTLLMERYRYLYRDKVVHDSIYVNDTIRVSYPVEVVKAVKGPLSGWENFEVWCGRIGLLILVAVFWKLRIGN